MRPFVVFAMPRSRSAWLGAFLTYGEWVCLHDISAAFQSTEDITRVLGRPHTGICDTQIALLWPEVIEASPSARLVTLRRPKNEIIASGERLGFNTSKIGHAIDRLDIAMKEIEGLSGVLKITFADLATEAGCKRVFEHCLPHLFDRGWWQAISPMNIQVDPEIALVRIQRNLAGIATTYKSAVHYYDGLMRRQA